MTQPSKTTVATPGGLLGLAGSDLGVSREFWIGQDQINAFADVTGDHQWIHVDVEKAAAGPFGSTIVHGFFTLALAPLMLAEILEVEKSSMGVNYGLDRVRFVTPVRPDEPVLARAQMVSAKAIADGEGVHASARVTVEQASDGEVCCVADIIFRYYD